MPGVDPVSLALGAAAEIPQGIMGAMQWSQANKALKQVNSKPIDEYSISPELQHSYQRAEGMTKYGFAPEETAAFNQGVARQQTGAFTNAIDQAGGNLSSAIGAALKSQNIGAQSEFAAKGAQLKAQHIEYADSIGARIQNQQNLMVQAKRQRREQLEQAYGQAKQAGISNVTNALSGIATGGLAAMSKKSGGGIGSPSQETMSGLQPDTSIDYNNPETITQ